MSYMVKTVYMNSMAVPEARSRTILPALSRSQDAAGSRRGGVEKSAQKAVPSFFVIFNGDEVTISSKKSSCNAVGGEQLSSQVAVSGNTVEISGLPDVGSGAAVSAAGVSLSSETVRNTRSFGPCDIQANRYAMQRYRQASSFRARDTSTFEITA